MKSINKFSSIITKFVIISMYLSYFEIEFISFIFSDNHCDDELILNHQNIAGVCKLSDINACGENEICVQNGKQSNLGNCYCVSGYKLQENNVST